MTSKTDNPKPRKSRPNSARIADAVAMVRKLGADAYMAGDKAKADRCEKAMEALIAIESHPQEQGRA